MKNVLKPFAKSLVMALGLTVAASATNAAIKKDIFGSDMTTMIMANEEMNDIMKTIKSLDN